MKTEIMTKEAFSVISKESSTLDCPGFLQNLWAGAIYDFTCRRTGENFMLFPIDKL